MSAFKGVRDGAGLVKACGPNTDSYVPVIPEGGTLFFSDVFLPVEFSPQEKDVMDLESLSVELESDRIRRLIFEIEFDQENRLRTLEGRSQITRAQYRDGLLPRYKLIS